MGIGEGPAAAMFVPIAEMSTPSIVQVIPAALAARSWEQGFPLFSCLRQMLV